MTPPEFGLLEKTAGSAVIFGVSAENLSDFSRKIYTMCDLFPSTHDCYKEAGTVSISVIPTLNGSLVLAKSDIDDKCVYKTMIDLNSSTTGIDTRHAYAQGRIHPLGCAIDCADPTIQTDCTNYRSQLKFALGRAIEKQLYNLPTPQERVPTEVVLQQLLQGLEGKITILPFTMLPNKTLRWKTMAH